MKFQLVENRQVDKYCSGTGECDEEEARKNAIIEVIHDCDAVLTMRIGYKAQKKLLKQGIMSVEYCYTVESGLRYAVDQLMLKKAI